MKKHFWFVNHGNPWFIRGTNFNHGSDAGVFAFSPISGAIYNGGSFRVVLSI